MDLVLIFLVFALVAIVLWIRSTRKSVDQASGKLARPGDSPCPKCKEFVKSDALVCRFCQADLQRMRKEEPEEFARGELTDVEKRKLVQTDPRVRRVNRMSVTIGLVFGIPLLFAGFFASTQGLSVALIVAWGLLCLVQVLFFVRLRKLGQAVLAEQSRANPEE
jgi:hypothetical protein